MEAIVMDATEATAAERYPKREETERVTVFGFDPNGVIKGVPNRWVITTDGQKTEHWHWHGNKDRFVRANQVIREAL